MIKLNKLTKVYRTDEIESTALNEVSFEINQGDCRERQPDKSHGLIVFVSICFKSPAQGD